MIFFLLIKPVRSVIQAFTSRLEKNVAYKGHSFEDDRNSIISSCFLSGFRHFVEGQEFIVKPSSDSGILAIIYGIEPETYKEFESVRVAFSNVIYTPYANSENRARRNTLGRMETKDLYFESIEETMYKFFKNKEYEKPGYEKVYAQVKDDPEYWCYRTIVQLKSIVTMYNDHPTTPIGFKQFSEMSDPVMELRNALFEGRDAHIIIKVSRGGKGPLQGFAQNELIQKGVPITVSNSRIRAQYDVHIAETFKTTYDSVNDIKKYFLDFDVLMTDDFRERFINQHDELKKMFAEIKDKEIKNFKATFYVQRGGGLTMGNTIDISYESLGFLRKKNSLNFDISKEEELEKAVWTILFYRFAVRDAFIMVNLNKESGDSNFLNIDAHGIYPAGYVLASDYVNILHPKFMWGHNEYISKGLTIETFNKYARKFGGFSIGKDGRPVFERGDVQVVFRDEELGLFTTYHNMGKLPIRKGIPTRNKLMLWYVYQRISDEIINKGKPQDKKILIEDLTDIGLNDEERYQNDAYRFM